MATGTQSENSKITPNSTQVPNLYLDQYMAFLTGEEWKVLSYTVRRTMGFHKQSDQISLSQYASGLTTKDGKRLDYGTGLSKPAVAKAVVSLVSFGLLIEVKPPRGNAGGVYALQLDDTLINHPAIMNRSNEQSKKNGRRTSNMRLRLVEQRAVSATDCNQSDSPVAVSATDRTAISATNTQKKGKESLGNKDSLQPAAGASVAGASEVAAKAVEPETIKEGSEPLTERKNLPGLKALAEKGRKPKAPQPTDPLFDAIGEHVFKATDKASVAAVAPRIALIMNGDKKTGRCIGIIDYECIRQNRERNELDYNQLSQDVGTWKRWHDNNKTFTVKDCVTVLDSWQEWRGNGTSGGTTSDWVTVEVKNETGLWVERTVHKSMLSQVEWR